MKTSGYYIKALFLILLSMLTSCRKELCYNHFAAADISLSWELEWERDYGKQHFDRWTPFHYDMNYSDLRPEVPEWVTLVDYKPDGSYEENFLKPAGGRLAIETSSEGHSYLLYNGDTEYIILSDMVSLNDARATATSRSRSSISYLLERHPGTRSTNPPDVLYGAFVENVPKVAMHQTTEIPIKMQPLVYTYLIRYEFEYGWESIALARGALGGMAESVFLRNGTTSDNSSIILFDCEIKNYGCEAKVRSFGVPAFPDEYYGKPTSTNDERPYTLNLEVMLNNGKIVQFNFDISDQIKNQPRGGVIEVSHLRIEDEFSRIESGFEVDVSDWGNHQDIDLPVGTPQPQ